ncbi:glycosyltransferase [Winogradskyella sp. SYSU M77433]|uniref:glycosyltransferase family 4 protein n=1 Tax=Winogradskyella sp. SYSU M77433 TaxID=3042722 RepID=UPI0024800197|nr:glycosyltransferase [Winogradskyella sp. SYSU M77433]MDH7911522.1 glycosyltransferase [Winogradskyella sp. SYSU M77433]
MIVVVRQLNIVSESWLTRQLALISPLVESIVVVDYYEQKKFAGIPVTSIDPRAELSYRLYNSVKKQDYKKVIKKRLERILTKSSSSVVLFHYIDFALGFYDVIKQTQKKIYIHCHGYDVTWDLRSHTNPNRKHFSSDYVSKVLKLSKHAFFIANSKCTKEKLLDIKIPENRVLTKYFGIQENEKRPLPNKFTILYVGRLVDFKGADIVINAFELACEQGLEGELIIAGDGALRTTVELLKIKSKYQDRIQILGSVNSEKVKALMQKASIFTAHNCKGLLTGQEEAFGVTLIEAMSYGIPIITGSVGGVNEIIVDKKTGYLIEPFNIQQHANAFLGYYRSALLLQKHGEEGHNLVKIKFSEEQEFNFFKSLVH